MHVWQPDRGCTIETCEGLLWGLTQAAGCGGHLTLRSRADRQAMPHAVLNHLPAFAHASQSNTELICLHSLTCLAFLLQAAAAESSGGHAPVVVRNAGTMGSRDLHLENFSVSNGGQDLIEVCNSPPALLHRACKAALCYTGSAQPAVCSLTATHKACEVARSLDSSTLLRSVQLAATQGHASN